ncbi:16061_t:CDS:2, partial [Gigaspora rosea]
MCSIEVNSFSNVSIPDTSNIQNAVEFAIVEFHSISFASVEDKLVTDCIAQISNEDEKFRNATTKSISESTKMAQYCEEIIKHVEFLMEYHVKGKDFREILVDLLSWAQTCKNESKAIEMSIQIFEVIASFAVSLTAIAATISVAVIPGAQQAVGATVLIAAAAEENAINTWRKRIDRYDRARFLESEVLKLEDVAGKINKIIEVTQQIIKIFNILQIFWQNQVDEVSELISRFNH